MEKVLKWTKKDIAFVHKIIEEAKERLNMQSWNVENTFVEGPAPDRRLKRDGGTITDAVNATTHEYEIITIEWMPAMLDEIKRGKLETAEEIVYHEIIHGLTQELFNLSLQRFISKDECITAVERLTQRITKIVCTKT